MLSTEAISYYTHRGANRSRIVLHSDLNNFFASVECLKHKALAAYPVAVCGSREERHGIVLAKNNLAKKCGVQTGQVIWQAKQLCPALVVLEPHYEEYMYFSQKVRSIYTRYSDRVEPFGMDEAWIELTGIPGVSDIGDGRRVADALRREVYEATGLTVSVGVSDNKTFAKLASDYKKPDAVTVLGPEEYLSVTTPLPVGDMMYVGRATQKRLAAYSIRTIGEVAEREASFFHQLLGKSGIGLYHNACGHDIAPVQKFEHKEEIKSIGNSVTTPRDMTGEDIKLMLYALCDKVCARLRRACRKATVLQIALRDTALITVEKQCTISPTDHADTLAEKALELYEQNFPKELVLRSIGVRTGGLVESGDMRQGSLFELAPAEATPCLDETIDTLRKRYGEAVIRRGLLYSDRTLYEPQGRKAAPRAFRMHG